MNNTVTTDLLANPAFVNHRMNAHRSDPTMTKPDIEKPSYIYGPRGGGNVQITTDDGDDEEYEEYEDDDGEEYEDDDGVDGDEFDDYPQQPQQTHQTQQTQNGYSGPPPQNFQQQQVGVNMVYNEKVRLLTKLHEYAMMDNEVSRAIPAKKYNLETPLNELQEQVNLCDQLKEVKLRAISRKNGINNLNNATKWLAGMIETANISLLEPESQFAVDGFHDDMTSRVDSGEFDDVHERMWEILAPKLKLDNPFLQWGLMFSFAAGRYTMENRNAYANGLRPDPRKHRAILAEQERKKREEMEGGEVVDDNEEVMTINKRPSIEVPADSSMLYQNALNPPTETSIVNMMNNGGNGDFMPGPIDFTNDPDSGDEQNVNQMMNDMSFAE